MSIGLYTPFVYLQQKAMKLEGGTKEAANRLILFLGIFSTVSRIATGALADRKWVDCLILHNVAAIVGGVATCFVPILNHYALLCIYSAIFGITIGTYALRHKLTMCHLYCFLIYACMYVFRYARKYVCMFVCMHANM